MASEKVIYGGYCVFTGVYYSVEVNLADLEKYNNKEGLASEIFTYLSAEDREFIISGISPMGWKTVFPD